MEDSLQRLVWAKELVEVLREDKGLGCQTCSGGKP